MISKRIVLVLFAVFLLAAPSFVSAGAVATVGATSVTVTIVPPRLPADGQTYPAIVVTLTGANSNPTVSLTNTVVYLTASTSNVGSLPASVTIPAGRSFVIANFTTTTTPGETIITASSPGLTTSSQALQTITTSGYPSQIVVFASPSTLLARPAGQASDQGVLIVELVDNQGLPAKVPAGFPNGVPVQLTSSNQGVVNVTQKITIAANSSLAIGSFQTGFTPGSNVAITATSSGFKSGSAQINVIGPAPLKLTAQAEPNNIPAGSLGFLLVSLTDQSGNPARAPSPVNVTIRSSNTTVITVPSSMTIPSGEIYSYVTYSSTKVVGTATITVTSPGLSSSSTVVNTGQASIPTGLSVLTSPNPVLSDDSKYNTSVIVQLIGQGSSPAAISTNTNYVVSLTSSNSQVGDVPSTVVIPEGSSYAVAYFQSTYASGTTTITASASNLLPAAAQMTTYGPVPAEIRLSIYGSAGGPGTELPATGQSYPALAVSLADSGGNPAVAPGNIVVQLTSSTPDIVSVDTTVTIPTGNISTILPLQTSLLPGQANITASSVGLGSGTLTVTTEIPAPAKLAAYLAPATALQPKTGNTPMLYIQLQDVDGNPATARQATNVVVTSSNGNLFNTSLTLTIPAGKDYAATPVITNGLGSGTLTATSSGLGSSSANLEILPFPFSANISLALPYGGYMYTNDTGRASATLTVEMLGQPLQNVNVTWEYAGAAAIPSNGTTNAAGQVETSLQPVSTGPANITAIASGAIFGTLKTTSYFTILATPPKAKPTFVQVLLSYIYYIIIAVAAVVVAGVYLLRMQRKKAKAELEAGFEAVS
jgi:hypothetical protein